MYQRPMIPITQLINPIGTPDQYQNNRCTQTPHKHLKPRPQRRLPRPRFLPTQIGESVVDGESDEDDKRDDLEAETSDGDGDGDVGTAA